MPTQRLTIREAAEHLGLSDATIRRRLKNGQLRGEQEQTAQGFRWHILLDREDEPPCQSIGQQPAQEVITHTQPPAQDDQAMIEHLEGEIEYLREQLAMTIQQAAKERERADVLQREALVRIEALTAGSIDTPEGTGSPPRKESGEQDVPGAADRETPPRGVWRRLWDALRG